MLAGRFKLVRAGWLQPKLAAWLAAALVLLGFGLYFGYDDIVAEYHFRAAQRAFHNRQFSDARAHVDVCLRTWPKSAATQLLTARIARGAGMTTADVNEVLNQFQMVRKMVRTVKTGRGGKRRAKIDLSALRGLPTR